MQNANFKLFRCRWLSGIISLQFLFKFAIFIFQSHLQNSDLRIGSIKNPSVFDNWFLKLSSTTSFARGSSIFNLQFPNQVSARSASIGSSRAAFHAGTIPGRTPTPPEAARANKIASRERYVGKKVAVTILP